MIGVYPDSIEGNSITLKNFSVELEFTGSVQFTYTVYHKDRALAGSKWRPIKVINKTHVGTGRNFYDLGNLNVEALWTKWPASPRSLTRWASAGAIRR